MKILLILTLLLTGCITTDINRNLDGCETVSYLCVGCYHSCGKKNLEYENEQSKHHAVIKRGHDAVTRQHN